ncbi:hypothetical protein GCM10027256_10790 [Novispirillum itersonii subsp. nipponicum]
MKPTAILIVVLALLPLTARADMYGFNEGRVPPAATEQKHQQDRAIALKDRTRQCDGLRQQLVTTITVGETACWMNVGSRSPWATSMRPRDGGGPPGWSSRWLMRRTRAPS